MIYSNRVLAQQPKGKGLLAIFFQAREEKQNKVLVGKELYQAIEDSNLGKIMEILTHYPEMVNGVIENNCPPLHLAAMKGKTKVAALLIKMGADVNLSFGKDFQSPLHQACWYGEPSMVLLLLEKGAKVNAVEYRGYTPLHIIHNLESAKILIRFGADIHIKDKKGRSPLMNNIISYGDIALIRHLVKIGSEITEVDGDGRNILDYISSIQGGELLYGMSQKYSFKLRMLFPRKLFE